MWRLPWKKGRLSFAKYKNFVKNHRIIEEKLDICKRILYNICDETATVENGREMQEEKVMAVVGELIRSETDGAISFGDYTLTQKSKLDNFEHEGDLFKIKTFREITKLERNGMFVYESVPGTAVNHFRASSDGVEFSVEAEEDVQITLELEPETEYDITVNHVDAGCMKTNLGGKLSLSVEMDAGSSIPVRICKA